MIAKHEVKQLSPYMKLMGLLILGTIPKHDGIHGGQLSMEQHFRRVEIKTALATFSSQLNGEGVFSLGTAALLIRDVSVRFRYRSAYGCTKDKLSSIFLLVCGRTGR